MVNQETLMAFLTHCSRFEAVSPSKFFDDGEQSFPDAEGDMQLRNDKSIDEMFKGQFQKITNPVQKFSQLLDGHLKVHDGVRNTVNVIFDKVKDTWQLIRQGFLDEVTPTLRSWKEELNMFRSQSSKYMGMLVFTLHYLHVLELLGKLWSYFMCSHQLCSNGTGSNGTGESLLWFRDLEKSLMEMRYVFIGLSSEDELHLLQLQIITCALRLCSVEAFSPKPIIPVLNSTISCMENMHKEGSRDFPNFVIELKKQLHNMITLTDGFSDSGTQIRNALRHFSLQQPVPSEDLRHKEAALLVHDNEFGKPLPFIPGLPVGIPLEITLHNISNEDRLWVRVTLQDEFTRFVFLDLQEHGECSELIKFPFVAPFYISPRAKCFSLKVCIVMECIFEDFYLPKDLDGAKHNLVQLCEEKEVYLSMVRQ